MWQKTKDGLFKEFTFKDLQEAFDFIRAIVDVFEKYQLHPRWQHDNGRVQIWISIKNQASNKDAQLSEAIDDVYNALDLRKARSSPDQIISAANGFSSLDVSSDTSSSDKTVFARANSPSERTILRKSSKPMPNNVEENTTAITEVKLYTDGGSRGNPGPSASGFVILNMRDKLLYKKGTYLGVSTNNQAEYNALKHGLDECYKQGAKIIHIYMDSLLIINQMKGIYKIKNKELLPINQYIRAGLSRFDEVKFTHIPRELNQQADAMVNEALDAQIF